MQRQAVPYLLCVTLLVLAGCGGTTQRTVSPSPTVTPAPVPSTSANESPSLAPGLTRNGVRDEFALGRAHAAVLANASFTLETNYSVSYPNGTDFIRRTTTARFGTNESRYYVEGDTSGVAVGGSTATNELWSNGTRVFVMRAVDGTRRYSSPSSVDGQPVSPAEALQFDPTYRNQIYRIFGAVTTRVTAQRTRDGTVIYRVIATRTTNPAAFESEWRNPRNVTLEASVSTRGLVRAYQLRYEATLDGTPVRVHREVRYLDVGSTAVERPPWYGQAIENTSAPSSATTSKPLS